ncbi:MAG: cytochrome c biogenesis protein CcdA [Gemmatimonadota bacterium]|nr:cytochrome c biogenesis protein CcdA [Gemmatimonadota bacterium]
MSLGLAFTAGLVSFLSPCVVPLVPSYLTFITGASLDELSDSVGRGARRSRTMVHATLFVLGFGIVFVSLGAAATAVGVMIGRSLEWMQRIGGVVIMIFGAQLLGLVRLPALMRERRVHLATRPAGLAGSFVVGVAFGAGWTPCVGPVLATILLYAGTATSVARGTLLLVVYALGLGLPFLACAYGFDRLVTRTGALRRWLRPLELVTGVALMLVGLALATGRFRILTSALAGLGQLINLGT